jgi:hypothetical protein
MTKGILITTLKRDSKSMSWTSLCAQLDLNAIIKLLREKDHEFPFSYLTERLPSLANKY